METKKMRINFYFALTQLFFSISANASLMFSESDLEQYSTTHSCIKCDLSRATLNGKDGSILDEARLVYAHLEGSFIASSFVNTILSQSVSYNIQSMVSDFTGANFDSAKFESAQLSGANFTNAKLKNANFNRANLSSADFTNANISGVNFNGAILIGSNLTKEQLSTAATLECALLPDGTLAPPRYEIHKCRDRW